MKKGLLLFLLFTLPVAAQEGLAAPRNILFRSVHTLKREDPKDKIDVRIALPVTIRGKQKIHRVRFVPEPSQLIQEEGRVYGEWVWDRPEPIKIHVEVLAELYPHALADPPVRPEPLPAKQREAYLLAGKGQPVGHPKIQALAAKAEGAAQSEELLLSLIDVVKEQLSYEGYIDEDQGALGALKSGKGDCTDYSDLLVSLCRQRGLPARSRLCLLLETEDTPLHSVIEVYLPQRGWVTVDPLFAARNPGKSKQLPSPYLYLSTTRDDPTMHGYFSDKAYWIYSENKATDFNTELKLMERRADGETRSRVFSY